MASEIELDYAADSQDMSLYYFDSDDAFGGGDVILNKGYSPLIEAMSKDIPILTHRKVVAIHYDENQVSVETPNGSFKATYVICTIPLGVLKSSEAPQFDPPLPKEKQTAIDHLKMSILHKTILVFPYVFWQDKTNIIGYVPEEKGHWIEYVNFSNFSQVPLLIGFNASEYADTLLGLNDTQIKDKMMEILRTMYGLTIPEPIAYVTTRWGEDPLGASDQDYTEMAKPVGHLLFAGEATDGEYFGTVAGAYLSGMREAKRIMEDFRK